MTERSPGLGRAALRTGAVVTVLAVAAVPGRPALRVRGGGGDVGFTSAYVGTQYHVGVGTLEAVAGEVTFEDVRFVDAAGLAPTGAWLTGIRDPRAVPIGGEVGDLAARVPENTFVPLRGARIAAGDGEQWQLVVTAVPTRVGTARFSGVRITYRSSRGGTGVVGIPFTSELTVVGTGPDPVAA